MLGCCLSCLGSLRSIPGLHNITLRLGALCTSVASRPIRPLLLSPSRSSLLNSKIKSWIFPAIVPTSHLLSSADVHGMSTAKDDMLIKQPQSPPRILQGMQRSRMISSLQSCTSSVLHNYRTVGRPLDRAPSTLFPTHLGMHGPEAHYHALSLRAFPQHASCSLRNEAHSERIRRWMRFRSGLAPLDLRRVRLV